MGDAADGEALLAVVEATRPDVVVMDVNMAGMDGITATRLVLERHPEVVVLVLSMVEDDASLAAAIEAKASGYILKASTTDQLPHAIRTVITGGAVFDSRMVKVWLVHQHPAPVAERPFPMLTDRELEVLGHLARGEANQTIARSLVISPRTVANHVSNLLMKLPALDRTDAVIERAASSTGCSIRNFPLWRRLQTPGRIGIGGTPEEHATALALGLRCLRLEGLPGYRPRTGTD